jgi:cytochrome c oxidase subunit 3
VVNWVQLRDMGLLFSNNTYKFGFVLTLLHALHIVGGIGPMVALTMAAFRGTYTSASHNGLRMLGLYWHFLDVVWLVLLGLLLGTA